MKSSKKKSSHKEWQKVFYIGEVHYQKDWGDHPQTDDWTYAWGVYNKATDELVTKRKYSGWNDACRGAAQIYNHIEKSLLE